MHHRYAAALVVLALMASGCVAPVRYQKGELLRTESRSAGTTTDYELVALQKLAAEPPRLIVWVDSRQNTTEEVREVYRKVAVRTGRRLSVEPSFFLWPWNVARTPVGLVGCTFSAVDCAAHYVAAGAGVVGGIGLTVFWWPVAETLGSFGLGRPSDSGARGTAGAFSRVFIGLLETPLLLPDLPHRIAYGTPFYPLFNNRPEFPDAWGEAIKSSWQFAWDYRAYPPLPVWTRPVPVRRIVPGEELPGAWSRRVQPGEWNLTPVQDYVLQGDGWDRELRPSGNMAEIDLRALAAEVGAEEVLSFTVRAETPKGPLSREFAYPVEMLRR